MRNATFVFAILFASLSSVSQDYLINFTGSGAGSIVDSVLVVNLHRGESLLMSGADTLHLTSAFGVQHFEAAGNELNIYPNPMSQSSTIEFFKVSSGIVIIGIFDVTGRCIIKIEKSLPSGRHTFEVSGLKAGIYFAFVNCGDNKYSGRLASAARQSSVPVLRYRGTIKNDLLEEKTTSVTGIVQMLYFDGERILLKGSSGNHSRVITFIPTQNETMDFEFVECMDAEGNHYTVVTIGGKTWMAENLNVGTMIAGSDEMSDNGIIEKYCYNDYPANCAIYGGLYQWDEMMNYTSVSGSQGICPDGWHVPSDEEWKMLEGTADSHYGYPDPEWDMIGWRGFDISIKLKATTTWYGNGTDDFGFSALAAGGRWEGGGFANLHSQATFWTSDGGTSKLKRAMHSGAKNYRHYSSTAYGFSARCLKNETTGLPSVTTAGITDITNTAAVGGGNVTDQGAHPVTARGVCWSTMSNPTILDSHTSDGAGVGTFVSFLTNLLPGTTYYVRAYATNTEGTSYGNQILFTTTSTGGFECGASTITDIDGNVYNTVLIGDQCWMKENLNVGTMISGSAEMSDNGIIEKYCYNDYPANCDIYGGLYQWDEMMNYTTVSGSQGICPDGWHVPSDEEWKMLEGTADSQYGYPDPEWDMIGWRGFDVSIKLKATTTWSGNGNGTDDFGFSALAAGGRWEGGGFANLHHHGGFWTSDGGPSKLIRGMDAEEAEKNYRHYSSTAYGYSVRCLKNETTGLPSVTTAGITDITPTTAVGGGNVTDQGAHPVTARGVCWSTTPYPTLLNPHTTNGVGLGSFESFLSGLFPGTKYYVRAYAINSEGTSYGNQIEFTTATIGGFQCGVSTVNDINGNVYNTVLIGNQCWMKENLKATKYRTGVSIPNVTDSVQWAELTHGAFVWYDNDISNKEKYGALYNWFAVRDSRGLCPSDWHVPWDNEWSQLADYVISQGFPNQGNDPNGAGNALKSCRQVNSPWSGDCNTNEHPRWDSHNTHNGFDWFNFSAYPGGKRDYYDGSFFSLGTSGIWWSSSEMFSLDGVYWGIYSWAGGIHDNFAYKQSGLSVRCVWNYPSSLKPEAAFTALPTSGDLPLTVTFADESLKNPTSWLWDFGDGNTSTTQNPVHIYNTKGKFTVKLTAGNIYGTDTATKQDYITVINLTGIIQSCPETPTVTDLEGNVYNTILIGQQCWMRENLKTIHYRNGTPIEYPGADNNAWQNNSNGAYAWVNSDISWKDSYGALYNWHAVNNSNGLCPTGWHVPSDVEWAQLLNYVAAQGFPNICYDLISAGNALKSCRQDNSPLGGDCDTPEHPRWSSHHSDYGFDEFGFSAFPGGARYINGTFEVIGDFGNWWSSSESSAIAWSLSISRFDGYVSYGYFSDKGNGFSVRCIRD